jgi:hypothetical protein
MAQPYARRPHFDESMQSCGCPEEALARLDVEVATKDAARRAEEGGRWIPPTGLPHAAE